MRAEAGVLIVGFLPVAAAPVVRYEGEMNADGAGLLLGWACEHCPKLYLLSSMLAGKEEEKAEPSLCAGGREEGKFASGCSKPSINSASQWTLYLCVIQLFTSLRCLVLQQRRAECGHKYCSSAGKRPVSQHPSVTVIIWLTGSACC